MDTKPIRILLVEDNPGDAGLIREMLRDAGVHRFDLVYAGTLAEATAQLDRTPVDALLLDLTLPDCTGLDTVKRVHEKAADVPIVVLTGNDGGDQAINAMQAGAQDYLTKGFIDGPSLVRSVRYAIERKRAQDALEKANAELRRKNVEMEQFVYTASHDLKSPLVTFLGFINYIKQDIEASRYDRLLEFTGFIERAAHRMRNTIDDLLRLSRAGRVTGEPRPVEVASVVRAIVEEMGPQWVEKGATVEVDPQMPVLCSDPQRIWEVFQNLLDNALLYGCDGPAPVIEVGAVIEPSEVRYFVRDNGSGIASEYHEKIFGLFQRIDQRGDGTGVGLAIVRRIAEVHGGRTWVESAPGSGSTFWIAFPSRLIVTEELAAA
jgi:signal transduction histidine kinase